MRKTLIGFLLVTATVLCDAQRIAPEVQAGRDNDSAAILTAELVKEKALLAAATDPRIARDHESNVAAIDRELRRLPAATSAASPSAPVTATKRAAAMSGLERKLRSPVTTTLGAGQPADNGPSN